MNEKHVQELSEESDGWFVSSFSNGGGGCVEVKFTNQGVVLVRDSKDSRDERPIVGISSRGWSALLAKFSKRGHG